MLQKDTLCHDTSKCLKRLCVYSPEVTGSCLLTSVASTMEPRKVRKLKILTGFRPVSDQFQTLCPDASETLRAHAKRKSQKRNTKGERKNEKKGYKNLNAAFHVKVNGHRQSKENKDIKRMTQLNLHKVSEAEDPGAPGPKTFKTRRHIFRNSKQGMEPKKLLIRGACYRKTPCAMIQASA